MGLEDTSIIKQISSMVGFELGKKKTSSPKAGAAKTKASANKSTAKKKTGQSAAVENANSHGKHFCVKE